MKAYSLFIIIILTIMGCGGKGGSGDSDSTNSNVSHPRQSHPPQITYLNIKGTSSSVNKVAPIDGSINEGKFEISWSTTLSDVEGNLDQFSTSIYLSHDNSLSGNDILIYDNLCHGQKCVGSTPFKALCSFSYNDLLGNNDGYSVSCDSGNAGGIAGLNSFINRLPKNAVVIFVVHGSRLNKPNLTTRKIIFR